MCVTIVTVTSDTSDINDYSDTSDCNDTSDTSDYNDTSDTSNCNITSTTLLSEKNNISYSKCMELIRCKLTFALLRSSIVCIRGSRSS